MSAATATPARDNEGFLKHLEDWNESVAKDLAAIEGIELTSDHWEVITLVRDYYQQYTLFPANRVLVNKVKETFGEDKGSSIHLMKLFTGKPRRVIAKVSGLPKPSNCD
jgi:tRNA 2-thiouridine synthesizing protein E